MAKPRTCELFFAKVRIDGPCWTWLGHKDRDGYGRSRNEMAHRASYRMFVGEIPPGMTIDHRCRVRDCVNPIHLEVVTAIANTMRGLAAPALNARKTHCKHGHPFDERNTSIRTRHAASGVVTHRDCRRCAVVANAKYRARKLQRLEPTP